MRIALFGFPLTGKSTLFQLLTGAAPGRNHKPGEARVGVSRVPDPRICRLVEMYQPKKTTRATVEYLDLPGVEKGQAVKALPFEQLRTADALAHVVRGFNDDALPHAEGSIDPARDVATMETELILADHTIAERRLEKVELLARKTNGETHRREIELLRKCLATLEQEVPLRNVAFDENEERLMRGFTFLSRKPLLVMVNAGEADAAKLARGAASFGLETIAEHPATEVVALSAKIEAEIADLDADDAGAFMADLGIEEPALDRVIRASYHLLGRISFFTAGPTEVRAWTIRRGISARSAAGAVHSDVERGFIRAEVVAFQELESAASWSACRERGTLRLEGQDYTMRDGDVVEFRFNV